MPTYEYLCTECGFEFEEFQSIAADPLHECPRCGEHVERKISGGSGLIFKGNGFYITDYKKNSSTKSETKETESKAS